MASVSAAAIYGSASSHYGSYSRASDPPPHTAPPVSAPLDRKQVYITQSIRSSPIVTTGVGHSSYASLGASSAAGRPASITLGVPPAAHGSAVDSFARGGSIITGAPGYSRPGGSLRYQVPVSSTPGGATLLTTSASPRLPSLPPQNGAPGVPRHYQREV